MALLTVPASRRARTKGRWARFAPAAPVAVAVALTVAGRDPADHWQAAVVAGAVVLLLALADFARALVSGSTACSPAICGFTGLLAGALLLSWPGQAPSNLAFLVGWYLLLTGAVRAGAAVVDDAGGSGRWVSLLVGGAGVVVGCRAVVEIQPTPHQLLVWVAVAVASRTLLLATDPGSAPVVEHDS